MGTVSKRDHVSPELLAVLLLESDQERRDAVALLLHGDQPSDALAALLEKLARLDNLDQQFDRALEREKLDSLRELAYGASHEINNPLTNISSRAQTLLQDEADPARRKRLESINRQAFRAHEMIADMMLFAKPPDMVPVQFDLCELIEQVTCELCDDASAQGTALVTRGLTDVVLLSADRTHLSVAIKALCENSLQAVASGGQVTISLLSFDTEISISVSDSGPGIPAAVRSQIFNPFYSGREAGRGLGFGLSKCWRIVDLHKGSIEVESREGMGATFIIRLPRESVPEDSAVTMLVHG